MDSQTRKILDDLSSEDSNVRYEAFCAIVKITDERVDWAYDIWDELLRNLRHQNNHVRAQASQLLCNLAKSDPDNRMLHDFDAVMAVTRDERFVTARHTLQATWKVGTAGPQQQMIVVDRLAHRFSDCLAEKNCTLIRYDIIEGLRKLYDVVQDETIRTKALELIDTEDNAKYRKKYATLWKR